MEQWRFIPGYEGLYEASTDGRIRSAEGKITSNARYDVRHWNQRIMKQKYQKRNNGKNVDAKVCLWKNGVEKTFLVSRLVAMTWCDGYKEGLTVNHKDGNPLNNSADNLEWLDIKANIVHGFENDLFTTQTKCGLTSEDGDTTHFRSMSEASRFLGRSVGYVSNHNKRGIALKSVNGQVYSFHAEGGS